MGSNKKYQKAARLLSSFLKIAPLSHALWRTTEAIVFSKFKLKKPILDVGCGFGEFAGVVFDKLEMGIDINEQELTCAYQGKKYKKVKLADARKMPFKSSSYNSVISVSVLEHIENVEKALDEIYRILKKGGTLIFTVPTTSLRKSLLVPAFFRAIGLPIFGEYYFRQHCKAFKHVSLKSSKWWLYKLNEKGFEIIEAHGTVSQKCVWLHELFLISAAFSQITKLIFKKRLIISLGLRAKLLPYLFTRFTSLDPHSDINMFFLVKKI